MIEIALESSINIGALENSSAACTRRFCSSPFLDSSPSRKSFMFTRAREHSMRNANWAAPISNEKINTPAGGPFFGKATASAKLSASDVLQGLLTHFRNEVSRLCRSGNTTANLGQESVTTDLV